MNPDETMKPMSAAAQAAILSKCEWINPHQVRVRSTHRSEWLLKRAGIPAPVPFECYDVFVERNKIGQLVLAKRLARAAPREDELPFSEPPSKRLEEVKAELTALQMELTGRTFEVPLGDHVKIRVQAVAWVDDALPSPGEIPRWRAAEPTDTQIFAACHALREARDVKHLEK